MKKTPKKGFPWILAIMLCMLTALMISVFPVFAETPSDPPEHASNVAVPECALTGNHVYINFRPAGNGQHIAVCETCGKTENMECVYAVPAVYVSNGDGTHSRLCTLCGGAEKHAKCEYEVTKVRPTQTAQGYTQHTCSLCGDTFADEYIAAENGNMKSRLLGNVNNDDKISGADARLVLRAAVSLEEIPPVSLPYADMDRNGRVNAGDARLVLRICVGLDSASVRHSYSVSVVTAAVCTASGQISFVCDYCGETGSMASPALPHTFGAPSVVAATCTANGYSTLVCSVCGAKKVTSIAKLGHKWRVADTDITCSVCGAGARRWVIVDGDTYYCDVGKKQFSWTEIGADYYFFDRDTGVMAEDTLVDGLTLLPGGKAKKTDYSVYKIQTLIRAKNIVASISSRGDSVNAKKLAAFQWVESFPYEQYRLVGEATETMEGFEMAFADDIFVHGSGCCGSTSYAFAFLAVECGCKDVYVCDDGVSTGGHAWVSMEGSNNVYDVIFAEANGFDINYNASVSDYRSTPPRMTYVGG